MRSKSHKVRLNSKFIENLERMHVEFSRHEKRHIYFTEFTRILNDTLNDPIIKDRLRVKFNKEKGE